MDEQTEVAPSYRQASLIRVAFDALALRVTRWVVMCMSFGLFVAAVWYPDWRRLAAACGFTILMALPVWFMRAKGG